MFAPATRKFATERASLQLHPEALAEPCDMVKLRAAAQRITRTNGCVAVRCQGSAREHVDLLDASRLSLFFSCIFLFQPGLAKTPPQDLLMLKNLNSLSPGRILLDRQPGIGEANTRTKIHARTTKAVSELRCNQIHAG